MATLRQANKEARKQEKEMLAKGIGKPKPNWERLRLLIRTGLEALGRSVSFAMTVADGVLMLDGYDVCIAWSEDGKYTVQQINHIRGVHYTRNGDGWPDEEDYINLKTFNKDSLANVARFTTKRIAERLIDDRIDGLLEEEMERELQERMVTFE